MIPKVSILIPVFNRKNFISECIQSALDQTYRDIEIVVVDNASNDGTWEICQKFSARDRRVRIFRNHENIGPVRNWKRCADEARGEFSKILFSDDIIENDCIELMLRSFEKHRDSAFVFSSVMIGQSKESSRIYYDQFAEGYIAKGKIQLGVVYGLVPVSPGAMLFRSSELKNNILEDIPTDVYRNYSSHGAGPDILISLRIISKYKYAYFIDKPLVYFRQHAGSFTVDNKNNLIKDSYSSAISYQLEIDNKVAWRAHLGKECMKKIISSKTLEKISKHSSVLGLIYRWIEMIKSIVIFLVFYVTKNIWSTGTK